MAKPGLVWSRILTFGFLNFAPALGGNWWLIILPLVLRNNFHITDPVLLVSTAGTIYILGFVGIILGALLWPITVTILNKKACLLISVFFMGTFIGMMGFRSQLWMFMICRVGQGLSANIHTVGKDFIFDYFEDARRPTIFSLNAIFALFGGLVGPLIGVMIYSHFDQNFEHSCFFVMGIFYTIGFVYLLFYYIFNFEHIKDEVDLEERMRFVRHTSEAIMEIDLKEAFFKFIKKSNMRFLVITYALSNGCASGDTILSVLFLQAPWDQGGYQISPAILSLLFGLVFIPSVALMLVSNKFVPAKITYRRAIMIFILIFCCAVAMTPAYRDLIPKSDFPKWEWIVLANQMVKALTNSHIYSPFIYYLLNKKLNKHIRTGINAIVYLISVTWLVIFVKLLVYIYSKAMYHPYFQRWAPLNKYIPFVVLFIAQMIPVLLIYLESKKFEELMKKPRRKISEPHEIGAKDYRTSNVLDDQRRVKFFEPTTTHGDKFYGHVLYKGQQIKRMNTGESKLSARHIFYESPF